MKQRGGASIIHVTIKRVSYPIQEGTHQETQIPINALFVRATLSRRDLHWTCVPCMVALETSPGLYGLPDEYKLPQPYFLVI